MSESESGGSSAATTQPDQPAATPATENGGGDKSRVAERVSKLNPFDITTRGADPFRVGC